ncbi:MAG: methyltransferase domain-containing protein [Acidobacteria bacterium]|nr:methyltransferase domain-containing protein [Acidobacteriota bacterium]
MGVSERFQGANVIDAGRLSPYWGEHAARYRFALEMVAGKRVLDIACGTGYGIGLLQQTARSVCGVDVDAEAAAQARLECGESSAVILGDGLRLPFTDASFDVVTSFETVEHIHDRPGFLRELERVLSPGGFLLLSTPNAHYTRPVNGKPSNPFHVYEYTPEELGEELRKVFIVEEHLGQSLEIGKSISPFYLDQQRLPRKPIVQAKLFGWRVMNKFPLGLRERLSEAIWKRPFYPTEANYLFSEEKLAKAPVQLAVCRKK